MRASEPSESARFLALIRLTALPDGDAAERRNGRRSAAGEGGPQAARIAVTMHGLWRLVVWGSTAATTLLIAVLSSRGRHLALD
jgi:hypothetical protein